MYIENFKLRELPFRLSPDPQFLFLSRAHARAKAYMESTIWFTDGFVVITGEIGAGKTTLIESFLRQLDSDVVIAQINQTQVNAVEFLQSVLVQFGFSPFKMKKAELIATLNSFLIEQYAAGRKVLLIIDEAQNLSLKVLEEIRHAVGHRGHQGEGAAHHSRRPARAQRETRLARAGAAHAARAAAFPSRRVVARRPARLRPASPRRGRRRRPRNLRRRHLPRDLRYSGGVPRLVNTLCDTAMMAAFNDDRDMSRSRTSPRRSTNCSGWSSRARASAIAARKEATCCQRRPAIARTRVLSKVVLSTEGKAVGELHLVPGRKVVGRTPDNDLQIDSKFISRHHCQLVTGSDGITVIEDLNSTNGIMVRGKRVRRHTLRDGDVVSIGQHEILYVDENTAQHLADTHDDLPRIDADAANEDGDDDAARRRGRRAR